MHCGFKITYSSGKMDKVTVVESTPELVNNIIHGKSTIYTAEYSCREICLGRLQYLSSFMNQLNAFLPIGGNSIAYEIMTEPGKYTTKEFIDRVINNLKANKCIPEIRCDEQLYLIKYGNSKDRDIASLFIYLLHMEPTDNIVKSIINYESGLGLSYFTNVFTAFYLLNLKEIYTRSNFEVIKLTDGCASSTFELIQCNQFILNLFKEFVNKYKIDMKILDLSRHFRMDIPYKIISLDELNAIGEE